MDGSVWQDNFDGTYTQLDDDYYVPATGYSYLDRYLMGLISSAEVPDFFILQNLMPSGKDANGHPIFKADRTKVTIEDVITAQGPRLPDVDHSQKKFSTGIVVCRGTRAPPEPGASRARQRHSHAVDRLLGDDHWTSRIDDNESALSVKSQHLDERSSSKSGHLSSGSSGRG